jgi:hypothetical protein
MTPSNGTLIALADPLPELVRPSTSFCAILASAERAITPDGSVTDPDATVNPVSPPRVPVIVLLPVMLAPPVVTVKPEPAVSVVVVLSDPGAVNADGRLIVGAPETPLPLLTVI